MSGDSLPPSVAAAPLHPVGVAGIWFWEARAVNRLVARLIVQPESRIEVGLWWNRAGGKADVQLVFGLYGDGIELGCLRGNGFDAPGLHRSGFGTFAVNVAVQALQRHCAPTMPVGGVLSNTDEDGLAPAERARLEENRRAFWRRFGLNIVVHGDPPLDYLQGTVGALRIIETGRVAGEFARFIPLADFSVARPSGF